MHQDVGKGYKVSLPRNAELGPAMRDLPNDRQRLFVIALLEIGDNNFTRAARMAGYEGNDDTMRVQGHKLGHNELVLKAIHEEASKRLHSGGILAVSTLLNLAKNAEKDADKIKASVAILNRIGMHEKTEHEVTVTNNSQTDAAMLQRIAYLSKELGVDGQKLLGHIKMPVVDAEFSVVDPDADLLT